MKKILAQDIMTNVQKLFIDTNIYADDDLKKLVLIAHEQESNSRAKRALKTILKNMDIARDEQMPMCQDTGMAVVFVEIGQDVHVEGDIFFAINAGIRNAVQSGYLRASVVGCPMGRQNTGDNTPAVVHYNIVPGDGFKITVMPKGFGSENKGAAVMLPPSAGIEGIEEFVLKTVRNAGGDPCPPIFAGVGIGGTLEKAALMAKEALLQHGTTIADMPDDSLASRLLQKINALNIGTGGLGGDITALGVNVLTYPTHIAGLPVAVNICCHVARHGTVLM